MIAATRRMVPATMGLVKTVPHAQVLWTAAAVRDVQYMHGSIAARALRATMARTAALTSTTAVQTHARTVVLARTAWTATVALRLNMCPP